MPTWCWRRPTARARPTCTHQAGRKRPELRRQAGACEAEGEPLGGGLPGLRPLPALLGRGRAVVPVV
eukprot:15305105-Alexandrium_andersonii.AAC.1